MPDGTTKSIALLDPSEARVTLGVATCPTGDFSHHLTADAEPGKKWRSVKAPAEKWLSQMTNSHLPAKHCWVSYKRHLWASVRYGLGCVLAKLAHLGILCHNFAYESLLFFGVNRNICIGWRYLPTAFGGCGLFSLSTECVIARLNLLLQYWLVPSALCKSLACSMEYLQLETGFATCPLSEPFEPLGPLCTHSWVRSLWESVQ